ncbi:hypothetical protein GGR88_001132 [Sphingomonas jejuensis]|jgi:hypothetical protein|uniref:Phage shock protein B n=1 Tax=Sphingomonas jejuensis TaxID=904715 RepID=A0ABX0XJZ0_9SPHN|nr:hypothetical protein [Sphingomonas jejuensis]NJC33658.1 hypothetical protein [Sphingomonas jejuensis]
MTELTMQLLVAASGVLGVIVVALATLAGWRQWLALKRDELAAARPAPDRHGSVGERIEIADLRERVRRLEAIAAGVDL